MANILITISIVYIISFLFIIGILIADHLYSKFPDYYGYGLMFIFALTPIYNTFIMVDVVLDFLRVKIFKSNSKFKD